MEQRDLSHVACRNGPIQPIMLPGNGTARLLQARLADSGLDARAILSPSVPRGQERIRVTLHSFNTAEEIETLVGVVAQR